MITIFRVLFRLLVRLLFRGPRNLYPFRILVPAVSLAYPSSVLAPFPS